ncbi:MAG: RecQ family ATP-dependent DNA helicase [Spirulinaceae cyanobacterium]
MTETGKDCLQKDWDQVLANFQRIWGYNDFRPPQGEIVRNILQSKDALIVLPTGGGKSVCFQLPALLQKGLTLVISPLVALMENQVKELRDRRLPAALLHSGLPTSQKRSVLQALVKQQLRLLYLSPETLLSKSVWEILSRPQLNINGLILDEAHCLVQWGDTFRPSYRRLGAIRPALLKIKPPGSKIAIAAFTATADPQAQQIITNTLQLQNPALFLHSPYRSNLNLRLKVVWTPKGRKAQLLKFIRTQGRQTGLIYVRSRRESQELAQWLKSLGYKTAAYHAGLNAQQRRRIEGSWLRGETQFAVCTSAFGMGINKPNVRWVVHFQAPQLLSEYIQEVGRAGRDGKPAFALTLVSEPTGLLDPKDKQRNRFFTESWQKKYQQAQNLGKQLPSQGAIEAITKEFPDGEIALALLHSTGKLQWQDPFHYQLVANQSSRSFSQLQATQKNRQKRMVEYLKTKTCRWHFLLDAFGFPQTTKSWRCGHCDNCHT